MYLPKFWGKYINRFELPAKRNAVMPTTEQFEINIDGFLSGLVIALIQLAELVAEAGVDRQRIAARFVEFLGSSAPTHTSRE